MKISGAQLTIALLERHGVSRVAGIPGGAVLPLYDALGRSGRIRHILARHEQAAGFIAQGMARITGRAGVCLVTSGPGVTNVVTALADAKLDSVPLLCIAGQVSTHLIGTDAFQEVATLDMVWPITKACYFVEAAHEIPRIMAQAFEAAECGRPGPVLIDLPKNVQLQMTEWDPAAPAATPPAVRATAPSSLNTTPAAPRTGYAATRADAYDEAAALIDRSQRPLLYCGGGVVKARALALARHFAERLDIPVTTTLMALGLMPSHHGLHLGMLGMHGARHTNHAIEAADLIIAIGARFDDRATGDPDRFAARAKIIHIDIDGRELGKIKAPTIAIQDDAANAFHELLLRTQALPSDRPTRSAWRAHIRDLKQAFPRAAARPHTLCSPHGIMQALGRLLTDDTLAHRQDDLSSFRKCALPAIHHQQRAPDGLAIQFTICRVEGTHCVEVRPLTQHFPLEERCGSRCTGTDDIRV